MKHYHVSFMDDLGGIHAVKVWAHNPEEAEYKATEKINGMPLRHTFCQEDIVAVERILEGE